MFVIFMKVSIFYKVKAISLFSLHMLHLCGGAVLHSIRRLVGSSKGIAAVLPPLGITESPVLAIKDPRWQQQTWDAACQCRRSVVTHSTEQTENLLVVHPRQRPLEHLHETLKLVETLTGRCSCCPCSSADFAASLSRVSLGTHCCAATLQAPHAATWCWGEAARKRSAAPPTSGQGRSKRWLPPARSWGASPGEWAVGAANTLPRSAACLRCCFCKLPPASSMMSARCQAFVCRLSATGAAAGSS